MSCYPKADSDNLRLAFVIICVAVDQFLKVCVVPRSCNLAHACNRRRLYRGTFCSSCTHLTPDFSTRPSGQTQQLGYAVKVRREVTFAPFSTVGVKDWPWTMGLPLQRRCVCLRLTAQILSCIFIGPRTSRTSTTAGKDAMVRESLALRPPTHQSQDLHRTSVNHQLQRSGSASGI
jgi:hypothetical protein